MAWTDAQAPYANLQLDECFYKAVDFCFTTSSPFSSVDSFAQCVQSRTDAVAVIATAVNVNDTGSFIPYVMSLLTYHFPTGPIGVFAMPPADFDTSICAG